MIRIRLGLENHLAALRRENARLQHKLSAITPGPRKQTTIRHISDGMKGSNTPSTGPSSISSNTNMPTVNAEAAVNPTASTAHSTFSASAADSHEQTNMYTWGTIHDLNCAGKVLVVIHGNVYEVGRFRHPGGRKILRDAARSCKSLVCIHTSVVKNITSFFKSTCLLR